MTRTAILDATEQIIRDEGYAAVTSRRVAAQAGLKSQLVHYYFMAMDDLFLAVFRRVEERHFERLAVAATAKRPLRALWELSIDKNGPRLAKEFIALATHRPYLRQEIARSAERTRSIFVAVLTRVADDNALEQAIWPPVVMAVFLDGAARLIISETALGTSAGHGETLSYVERLLERYEPLDGTNSG